jgi:hypothetical protein
MIMTAGRSLTDLTENVMKPAGADTVPAAEFIYDAETGQTG